MIDLRQEQARAYRQAARRRRRVATAVTVTVAVGAALTAAAVDDLLPGGAPGRAVLLVALIGAVVELAGLPFALAGHRAAVAAGLSVQARRGVLADRAKALVIAAAVGLPAAAAVIVAQQRAPQAWPLLGAAASVGFALAMTVVAPVLLLPLFLRSAPLAPGPLREMADEMVARSGLAVHDIRLLEMSRKTTSANAAVVGLGPTRRILLGDTLVGDGVDRNRLTETRAVLAHELAHHAHRDTWRLFAIDGATSLLVWLTAAAVVGRLPAVIVHEGPGDPAALPALAVTYGALAWPLGFVQAWYYRRRERAADAYACRLADGHAFAAAMERLVASNLAELRPPDLERFRSTHPPPGERIAAARAWPLTAVPSG